MLAYVCHSTAKLCFFFNCFTFICTQTGVKILCPYERVSLCLHVCVCMVSVCVCDVYVCVQGPDMKGISSYSSQSHSSENPV